MSVTINFDLEDTLQSKFGDEYRKLNIFIAHEFIKVTEPFVPFREGYLKNSVRASSDGSYITYNTPYAQNMYYGVDYDFNEAPQRGALWAERSWATNKEALIKTIQDAIEGGTFK